MREFSMQIAHTVFRVRPLYESTMEYCKAYLTEQEPQHTIEVSPEDLVAQQALLEREAVEQGLKIRKFKDPFLERAVIQRQVADYLVERDTLMLHGSTIAVDDGAYLFTAPCGTGKSTHTHLWREYFGQRARMVNDDMPFLRLTEQGTLAYGSPWSGKHGLANNICVPLKGICLLHRGTENLIKQADRDAFKQILYQQVHAPEDSTLRSKTFALVDQLVKVVPLWEMNCNKELDAARVAYEAMCSVAE